MRGSKPSPRLLPILTQNLSKLCGISHWLLIESDFSRTPAYNDGEGKDHWPFGSAILLSKRPGFGNRVLGITDDDHWPTGFKANLQPDGPLRLQPRHLQALVRHLLQIDHLPLSQRFVLNSQDLDLRALL